MYGTGIRTDKEINEKEVQKKIKHLGPTDFQTRVQRPFNGERTVSSTNGTGTTV